jgi:hypothetical protein
MPYGSPLVFAQKQTGLLEKRGLLEIYIRPRIYFPLTDPLGIYLSTLFIFETGFEKPLTSPIQ